VPKPAAKPKEEPKPAVKPKEESKPAPKPKEEPKPAPKPKEEMKPTVKPKEEPKPAPKPSKAKKAVVAPMMVGGKYVVAVGEGGCRGKNWKNGPWPVEAGVASLTACAAACLAQSCTAFHR
jgi:hypothetical protein